MGFPRPTIRTLLLAGKIALAGAILTYLVVQIQRQNGFDRLIHQPKNWTQLAVGVGCIFVSLTLSFVRWHMLVRALGLPFRLVDALRLGALGFALNFVALGNVGGDVFKAVFIAQKQPGRRTDAVATVLVDRVVGLFTMMVIASAMIVITNLDRSATPLVGIVCRGTLLAMAIGTLGLGLALWLPGITHARLVTRLARVPLVGPITINLLQAVETYRTRKGRLFAAFALSVIVDLLFITSYFWIGQGLPVGTPALAEHLFIVPVATIAGALPITPSGAGTLELVFDTLYRSVPGGVGVPVGDGAMVALAQRVGMMMVAAVGLLFYALQLSRGESPGRPAEDKQAIAHMQEASV